MGVFTKKVRLFILFCCATFVSVELLASVEVTLLPKCLDAMNQVATLNQNTLQNSLSLSFSKVLLSDTNTVVHLKNPLLGKIYVKA